MRKPKQDLVGKKFSRLAVLSFSGPGKSGHFTWKCRCDCGVVKDVIGQQLISGSTKSCGCLRKQVARKRGLRNIKDLAGERFGILAVVRRDLSKPFEKPRWVCHCNCGVEKSVRGSNLRNGTVKSCGCLVRRRGSSNPSWRGGRSTRDGYVTLTTYDENGDRKTVLEHRLVMEKRLGRSLRKNENVHHKNGVKKDNRPENLELWVKVQPCGQRVEDLIEFCVGFLGDYAPDRLRGL